MIKKLKITNRTGGFTFVELLVVVTIIAVITGIAVASYQTTNQKARDTRRKSDLEQIRAAMELCRSEYGGYPVALRNGSNQLQCGDGNIYLDPVPYDPRDGQTGYTYAYTRGYSSGATTEYQLCAATMEGEDSPYCVYNP